MRYNPGQIAILNNIQFLKSIQKDVVYKSFWIIIRHWYHEELKDFCRKIIEYHVKMYLLINKSFHTDHFETIFCNNTLKLWFQITTFLSIITLAMWIMDIWCFGNFQTDSENIISVWLAKTLAYNVLNN